MRRSLALIAIAITSLTLSSCDKKETQNSAVVELAQGAKKLQAADITNVTTTVKQNAVPAITPGDYIIEGEKRYNGWFLSAERVIFKPGAKLIFTRDALAARPNFFILAKEIASESPESPGVIVWEAPVQSVPTDSGTATAGIDKGNELKTPGGNGEAGRQGNAGPQGADAPSLTLVSLSIKSPLIVNLAGQSGGTGGKGQNGGRGGGGGKGDNASQDLVNCRRGAGNGYQGGTGGAGGTGGPSGAGGRGGTFTLVTSDENMAAASRLLKVDVSGGQPGASGGAGGDGGVGGPGGPGGAEARPYCTGNGSQGNSGAIGQTGATGVIGQPSGAGDFFVGGLTPKSITGLLNKE